MAAALGACSTPVPPAAPAPVAAAAPAAAPAAPPPPAPVPATPKPVTQSTVTTVSLPAHLDPKSEIYKGRSIYFDFDSALLKKEFEPLVDRHGRYLVSSPQLKIRVEGHADERGSAEYNLALGQKRAEAVQRALAVVGVTATRMEAISWGKEKPRALGHDESAWAQNRRADLQYPPP
jgi:peptidoglycan-associated lipoprotein